MNSYHWLSYAWRSTCWSRIHTYIHIDRINIKEKSYCETCKWVMLWLDFMYQIINADHRLRVGQAFAFGLGFNISNLHLPRVGRTFCIYFLISRYFCDCVCICICDWFGICICICIFVYNHFYICACIRVCICFRLCVFPCICGCMCIFAFVHSFVFAFAFALAYAFAITCICIYFWVLFAFAYAFAFVINFANCVGIGICHCVCVRICFFISVWSKKSDRIMQCQLCPCPNSSHQGVGGKQQTGHLSITWKKKEKKVGRR